MNNGTTIPSPGPQPDAIRAVSETQLAGWRPLLARAVVLSVIGVTALLGIVALLSWRRLATLCEDAFSGCLMTPEQVAPLARLGITPPDLALGVVLLCCSP